MKALISWLFGWIANSVRFGLSMTAQQIRALMCWGMLLGVAVEGVCVMFLVLASRRYNLEVVMTVIFYSELLRIVMVLGVVFIAIQANSIKARIGDTFDFEAVVEKGMKDGKSKELDQGASD